MIILEEPSDFVKFMNIPHNHYSYEFIHMIDNVIRTNNYPEGISKKEKKRIDNIIKIYKGSSV
jgi:hypothetical protein